MIVSAVLQVKPRPMIRDVELADHPGALLLKLETIMGWSLRPHIEGQIMRRGRRKSELLVSADDREHLLRWRRRRSVPNGLARRADIFLRCSRRVQQLGCGDPTAGERCRGGQVAAAPP